MSFLDLAKEAVARGLNVVPLRPKDKAPLHQDWTTQATQDETKIQSWNTENPEYNCGAVASRETYWIIDVDCMSYWIDILPEELAIIDTYTVRTGGGGRHYYFLHDAASLEHFGKIRHLKNPDPEKYTKNDGSRCDSVIDIIGHHGQVLVAGCIHPKTGKPYETSKNAPLRACPPALLKFLVSLFERKKSSKADAKTTINSFTVRATWDPVEELPKWGLKFDTQERDGVTYLNYHVKTGRCLLKGELHIGDGGSNEKNNECSAFGWNPKTRQLWHKCQAASCAGDGMQPVKDALAALGLDWKLVFLRDGQTTVKFKRASDIKPEHITWLWPGYLPSNKLLTFAGSSTQGKSPVTLDLAARLSRGGIWPDGTPNTVGPRSVVILASEDDWADTMIPRLMLAGADLDRIIQVSMTTVKGMEEHERNLTLDADLEHLIDAIREEGNVGLVIIDPITNYLGKVSMNKEDEVRGLLMPLAIACQDLDVCVVVICHVNKRSDTSSAQQRIMGAGAFFGISRGAFFFENDKDEEDKHAHVMMPQRIIAPALKYKTVGEMLEFPDHRGEMRKSEVVKIVWGGVSDSDADDDLGKAPSTRTKNESNEAGRLLVAFLQSGPKPSRECASHLMENGYKLDSLGGPINATRLRKKFKVKGDNKGNKTMWSVETSAQQELGGM